MEFAVHQCFSALVSMSPIKTVKLGWKALEAILNNMIAGINQRGVTTGDGLSFEETDNGKLIWVTKAATDGTGPDGGAWITIDVMDINCNRSTIQVWARGVPPVTPP